MRRCPQCRVALEGDWTSCPLCAADTEGESVPSPLPAVPLRFSQRRLLRALFVTSLAVILASFLVQPLFTPGIPGLGVLRSVWLGLAAMWLVVLMAVRKRRNLAKSTVYLVVLVSLVSVYWDYLVGWSGWSVTYVVPILCGSSVLAVIIIVRAMRIEIGEHIVYTGLTMLLGLVPLVLLAIGLVTTPLPSLLCGGLSLLALVLIRVLRGSEVDHEVKKRLHL